MEDIFKPILWPLEEKYSYSVEYIKNKKPYKMFVFAFNEADAVKEVMDAEGNIQVTRVTGEEFNYKGIDPLRQGE